MRKFTVIAILLFSLHANLFPGDIKVRLFYSRVPAEVVLKIRHGSYLLSNGGLLSDTLHTGTLLFISDKGDKISVTTHNGAAFLTDSLSLTGLESESYFGARIPGVDRKYTEYGGNLSVTGGADGLKLINILGIEEYVAAVVQAEGGYKAHPEYFKSQAVIARTYAYLNLGKHAIDGYDLCDDVHCQVYKGRCTTKVISDATGATEGLVVAGSDSVLVLTPFHSNCGGETLAADMVWLTGAPNLKPVIDPYCQFSGNAKWERKISRSDWEEALEKGGYGYKPGAGDLSFDQPSRKEFYSVGPVNIPLTYLRSFFGLRSTFFSVTDLGSMVLLKGRGYGHGVGLCQEGAMVMANRGFDFRRIIGFYYNNVIIINVKYSGAKKTPVNSF